MFQEYPKGLYLNGDIDAENVVVFNKEEEEIKREEGYMMLSEKGEQKEELKAKAKELGIKGYHLMGEEKLKEAIKGK